MRKLSTKLSMSCCFSLVITRFLRAADFRQALAASTSLRPYRVNSAAETQREEPIVRNQVLARYRRDLVPSSLGIHDLCSQ
jgi:hypothetical protein